ncbi:MAG: hypothetical protein JJU00_08055 [Opitutales bacterium]|nr:hypothetical protein [Opitutales bacterium]
MILFRTYFVPALLVCAVPVLATPYFFEGYEDLEPGDKEPNFPAMKSNHPTAEIEVRAETPGEELFYPGNTRYLRVNSLSGFNPDDAGSETQFHGGVAGFMPFDDGPADVVTAGFDFIVGPLHAELLLGVGEAPSSRTDDQHFAAMVRVRGPQGLSNNPEIVTGPAGNLRADIQEDVPYRVEFVANRSGGTIEYESPLGRMALPNQRLDVYLFNHRTGQLQLILEAADFQGDPAAPKRMDGFFFAVFRYDATGRSLDIKLNDIAVYKNEVALSGHEFVPPGPATAIADFEDTPLDQGGGSPLWNLPGNVVEDTSGLFGPNNLQYFHIDRRNLSGGMSDKFRFNGVVELVSFGLDFAVHRDEVINSFGDAHDEMFFAVTGGDTIANDNMTVRLNIRGTRSVGNQGDPSEATPQLAVFEPDVVRTWSDGLDWEKPYRLEVVMNQTGSDLSYNTPWADGIALPNEHLHVYLFDLSEGENVALAQGRPVPYVIEGKFFVGVNSPNDVAGTMADLFWKHVTGRRLDMSIDNIVVYEDAAVVTNPVAVATEVPRVSEVGLAEGESFPFQPVALNRFRMTFQSEQGLTYGMQQSGDLTKFSRIKTVIPADDSGDTTTVEVRMSMEDKKFYRFFPLSR